VRLAAGLIRSTNVLPAVWAPCVNRGCLCFSRQACRVLRNRVALRYRKTLAQATVERKLPQVDSTAR
jgi:hypothetical protein